MTIRDKKNKAVSEELLKLVAESFSIDNKFDIVKKGRIKGNGFRDMCIPRRIFFYLLKKHTDLKYREINDKLGCVTAFDHVYKMVAEVETLLRDKKNIEFIHQVKLIERDIKIYITTWQEALTDKL